jgi:hypothetical protein
MQDVRFSGDTSIKSGIVFHGLEELNYGEFTQNGIGPFIHIDSSSKKVLFVWENSDIVATLYDFSMTVGDSMQTFWRGYLYGEKTWHVIEDSTMLFNGEVRRYLKVAVGRPTGRTDYWIEGIGSVQGLFRPVHTPFELVMNLVCFSDSSNGFQYQPFEFFSDLYFGCQTGFSVEENSISNYIKAYPNPASETLVLENLYEESLEYVIYSMDGKKVEKLMLSPQSSSVVNIKNWPSGMYSLLVSNAKGSWFLTLK